MTIGIKYNWRYRDLPDTGHGLYQPTKGIAHDSRYAQALGRNMNYALANKAAVVLGSGFDSTNNYLGSGDGTERLGPRGRAILWPPFVDVTFNAVAKYITSNGTIKLYVTDTPWTAAAAGSADKTATITVNNAAYTEFTATIEKVPVASNLLCYWYTLCTRARFESWILYATPYEP
jgi:hypothetical protein